MIPTIKSLTLSTMEHLSHMGHREMARSYRACGRILLAAGGAGLITSGTVVFKTVILHSSLSWLGCGLFATLNFALSFLFMQALGFRLATKQSSLLGAALAKTAAGLHRTSRQFQKTTHQLYVVRQRSEKFREELRWSLRTQSFSALGNLTFVIPAVLAFHFVYRRIAGAPFLDADAARALLGTLHPWKGGTLAYAAFTGCILWWCTLCGAALANRLRSFSKHVASAAFNILLGFILAFTPLLDQLLFT